MNFELIKQRAKEQAAKAKDAALSIRNLDEMAANDDYIHKEYRTTEPRKKPDFHNALLQADQFSMMNSDEGNKNDEEVVADEEIGIELKRKRKKKDPNRFMEDISERLAKPEEDASIPLCDDFVNGRDSDKNMERQEGTNSFTVQNQNPLLNSISSSITKIPVLANTFSKLKLGDFKSNDFSEEEKKSMLGPLSRRRDESEKTVEDPTMNVVVSSSFLDADEQAELERIRTAGTSTNNMKKFWFIMDIVQKNPHFTFIIFTLLLGSAVYFYSRHREELDEIL